MKEGLLQEAAFDDGPDAFLDMATRRLISSYALHPVDFNYEGQRLAQGYSDPPLSSDDVVLDIGCSSGQFALEAAQKTAMPAHLIGLDPLEGPNRLYLSDDYDTSRFSFIQGVGERIPLVDNAVRVATAHNVVFRAQDLEGMLGEMKRVVTPGGLLVISTNCVGHAFWRHRFEKEVARRVSLKTNHPIDLNPPAQGCYMEDLLPIIEASNDLSIVDQSIIQTSHSLITPGERFSDYKYAIQTSVNATQLPPEFHHVWRETVNEVVDPVVMRAFAGSQGSQYGPYFPDPVRRGMLVLRNLKAS